MGKQGISLEERVVGVENGVQMSAGEMKPGSVTARLIQLSVMPLHDITHIDVAAAIFLRKRSLVRL